MGARIVCASLLGLMAMRVGLLMGEQVLVQILGGALVFATFLLSTDQKVR